ncbi:MAG: FtsW/RodA/SpoVE family cell cycle protein, partial [Coriobacteriales bacterium]|nr:FtsW/RodA/SpoVE family cell cycle protein [Coriobacteriales bacterium]
MSRRDDFAGGAPARYLLLGATLFLTLVGLVMIFSASSISDVVKQGASTYHLVKQLIFIAIGLVAAVAASRFDYRVLQRHSMAIWVGALIAVAAT